jgi:hypothetical protein
VGEVDGRHYIAMQYVAGGSLKEISDLISVREKAAIMVDVADALHAAHRVGLIHRDIKPANIMVGRDRRIMVTDFGIAKARNEISTTSPGMIKGKLGYIAPEQLAGADLDQRVDIFCAGILLWESLAARRLFKGEDEIDTFRLISECEVPPLSEYRDDVTHEIETTLHGALTKRPEDRYKTADEFYDSLNEAIFPYTADDYQTIARQYFDDHPKLFEGIASLAAEADGMQAATVELSTAKKEPEELAVISDFLVADRKPRAASKWIAVTAALALLVGGTVTGTVVGGVGMDAEGGTETTSASDTTATQTSRAAEPLTTQDVQLAVNGERTRFLDCYASGKKWFKKLPAIEATLVVASTGGVAKTNTRPPLNKLGPPGRCIEEILRGLKFPPHPDKMIEAAVDLPAPRDARVTVAGSPTRSPTRAGTTGSARGAGRGGGELTKSQIQSTLQRNLEPISRCLNNLASVADAPRSYTATVTISTAGRIVQVKIAPAVPVPSVEQCLRKRLRDVRFPSRPSTTIKVKIPLNIQVI